MWPFGKRLKDQDAVEKYRRWMRRWLLGSWRYVAAGSLAAAILAAIIWTAVNTWNFSVPAEKSGPESHVPAHVPAIPAPQNSVVENFSTSRPEDKPVKTEKSTAGGTEKDTGRDAGNEVQTNSPTLSTPVSGQKISSFGYHYSPLYADYRFHTGITIQSGEDSGVHPCLPGTVTKVTGDNTQGFTVEMEHGGDWRSTYSGLASVSVSEGNNLSTADILGRAGTSGETGGKGKIRFTLLRKGNPVDPAPYMKNPATQ